MTKPPAESSMKEGSHFPPPTSKLRALISSLMVQVDEELSLIDLKITKKKKKKSKKKKPQKNMRQTILDVYEAKESSKESSISEELRSFTIHKSSKLSCSRDYKFAYKNASHVAENMCTFYEEFDLGDTDILFFSQNK